MECSKRVKQEEMDDDLEDDPFITSFDQWLTAKSPESDAFQVLDVSSSYGYKPVHRSLEECIKFPGSIKLKKEIGIEDVVKEHALHFLPAKSLCKFKTVSKEWDQWIKNPFFSHKQAVNFRDVSGLFTQFPGSRPSFISLDRTASGIPSASLSFLPESVDIRASCNGLLCCQGFQGDQAYYICNPVTEKWRILPQPNFYHGPGTAVALAFEPSLLNFAENYELICAVSSLDLPVLTFEIYSSRTNSWRATENSCFELDVPTLKSDGFYTKGYAYWETESGGVLAFDLKSEDFGIINLPPCSGPTGGVLAMMHGDLCYIVPRKLDQSYIVEVYGDMAMNMKKVFTLAPPDGFCRALCFVNDDTLILDVGGCIMAYHVSSHKVERLAYVTSNSVFSKYLPYVNSLVSVC